MNDPKKVINLRDAAGEIAAARRKQKVSATAKRLGVHVVPALVLVVAIIYYFLR